MAISSRITSRSASTSAAASVEEVIMSPSTSTASGRSSSSTRAWKQVYSFAVNALNSPPTSSSATEMSSAERVGVPLKSRCSRKCEAPERDGDSSRDPTPTHTPMEADRTPGSASVTTRSPPGSTVRRTSAPPSCSDRRVWVVPGFCCAADDAKLLGGLVRIVGLVAALDDRDQRQLAAVVDLADLDLDLLADRDDVLDVLDPLAAGQRAQLADVQQAVLAREQRDERTEVRRLDDGAEVALADLGHRRVRDAVDDRAGRLRGLAVGGADVDRAVVLDGDLRAGVVLDLVDDLALGADHLADLVDRDLHGDDPRRVEGHLARCVDGLGHHLEDRHPGVLGLGQRTREDLGRDAVELGVELERGDELLGAGDLEVHVAEGVSAPRMSVSATYCVSPSTSPEIRPIAMPATEARSGTPAWSSDIVDAQTEPIDVEPLEPIASES